MPEVKGPFNPRLREMYPDFTNVLGLVNTPRRVVRLEKGQRAFSQGARADAVFFIQKGKVKISSVSADGKEAIFAVLGPHAFFGEACLAGQSHWLSSATAIETTQVLRIEKRALLEVLRRDPDFCATFNAGLLNRIVRLEEDVRAQFFYDNSRKLARVLLRLAHLSQSTGLDVAVPRWSHENLGKMLNASRSHITRLMNRFRRLGLIDYDRALIVKTRRILSVLAGN